MKLHETELKGVRKVLIRSWCFCRYCVRWMLQLVGRVQVVANADTTVAFSWQPAVLHMQSVVIWYDQCCQSIESHVCWGPSGSFI